MQTYNSYLGSAMWYYVILRGFLRQACYAFRLAMVPFKTVANDTHAI